VDHRQRADLSVLLHSQVEDAEMIRRRIPKPAQNVCAHCDKFFVYFKITKTRMYCAQACATKAGNDYHNGLETAARRAARAA